MRYFGESNVLFLHVDYFYAAALWELVLKNSYQKKSLKELSVVITKVIVKIIRT